MKRRLRRAAEAIALIHVLVQMGLVAMLFNIAGPAAAEVRPAGRPVHIVALGDSLTAGFGLQQADSFPVRLEAALKAKGFDVSVTNAGVSGDTSADGLRRLDWSVPEGTDAVILELGANDALRGIDPALTERALDQMLSRLTARKIRVLLAGMKAPDNWGADYATRFDAIYARLAQKYGVALYPFFLDGVVGRPELNQGDGLHPLAGGVAEIVKRILPSVETLVAGVGAG